MLMMVMGLPLSFVLVRESNSLWPELPEGIEDGLSAVNEVTCGR